MAVSCLTVALDSTILVPVLPTLALELDGTADEAFWTGTSYLLASAVVQPFVATLSDIFGRRSATLVSVGLFAIASLICGLSHSFSCLLSGRVLQGVGGGGIISQSQIVFADIVPLRQRPRYFSLVLGAWAIGSMLGPLVGGAFVESAHNWRWCFYLNIPICGISLVMCFIFLHLTTTSATLVQKLCMVDWTGGFLFVSSLTSFLIAVSWGGITYAWTSWHTLVPLVVGLAGTVVAIFYEWRVSANPFIIKTIFCNKSSIITYLSALFQGLVLFMALYYVSFYMAAAKLKSPIEVGISLLPATVLLLPGSIVCSQLVTRVGAYRPFMWTGWATTTVGASMMTYWGSDTSTPYWAASLSVLGLGLGATLSCLTFAVQASTESALSSSAAAMYAFMRSLGMSLGVAVGGTVFQNLMKTSLRDLGLDEQIATDAEGWVSTTLRHLPVVDAVRGTALDAYVHGFRGVWMTMATVSGFALLTTFAVKPYSMDRILETKVVLHKKRAQCSGVRNPGEYTRRSELATPAGFDRDFNFITGLERGLQRADDVLTERKIDLRPAANLRGWRGAVTLDNAAEERGVSLVRAPLGLSRRSENKSKVGGKEGNILVWTVEWISWNGKRRVQNFDERKTHLSPPVIAPGGKEGLEGKEQSATPCTAQSNAVLDHIHLYLHRPETTSKIKCLIPLSTSVTIKDALRGRRIVEFPTIYVRNEPPEQLPLPFMLESKYLEQYGEDIGGQAQLETSPRGSTRLTASHSIDS
ncbi:hypothetical protein DV737_g1005, partial [Chaetothyriales sp. CBS 132003]